MDILELFPGYEKVGFGELLLITVMAVVFTFLGVMGFLEGKMIVPATVYTGSMFVSDDPFYPSLFLAAGLYLVGYIIVISYTSLKKE